MCAGTKSVSLELDGSEKRASKYLGIASIWALQVDTESMQALQVTGHFEYLGNVFIYELKNSGHCKLLSIASNQVLHVYRHCKYQCIASIFELQESGHLKYLDITSIWVLQVFGHYQSRACKYGGSASIWVLQVLGMASIWLLQVFGHCKNLCIKSICALKVSEHLTFFHVHCKYLQCP